MVFPTVEATKVTSRPSTVNREAQFQLRIYSKGTQVGLVSFVKRDLLAFAALRATLQNGGFRCVAPSLKGPLAVHTTS